MFASIFQSLTSLLLGGVFCYAIFVSERLKNRKRTQQALIGLVLGGLVISLGVNGIIIEPMKAPLDAKAGPLFFAGYLGGPIGALIAGSSVALFRFSLGGPIPILGVFISLAMPLIGAIVSYLHPPRDWPITSRSGLAYILLGFCVFQIAPVISLTSINPSGGSYLFAVKTGLTFALVGMISILLTWQILNYAAVFASASARSAALSRRLHLTLQYSGMGMFDRPFGSSEASFDAGFSSIYGLNRETGTLLLTDWAAMVHPDDLANVVPHMQNAKSGEHDRGRFDCRIIRPDGALRHIRAHWFAEKDRVGKITCIVGLHTDITDIRQAEQRHLASIKRLAMIAENLPGIVYQADITDREKPLLKYIGPKCLSIWGYSDEEFYADDSLFRKAHDTADRPFYETAVEKGIATGQPISHRYQITTRDGDSRWLDFHGDSFSADGRVYLEAIVLDVTREVGVQEQVEKEREIAFRAQKNDSIGHLTGGVAHDFNNILAVVLGCLELLGDENEPPKQQELIDTATAATLRGADLTKSLLAFARQMRLSPEVLDLNNVVREAKNWMGRTLPESVTVETSLLAGLWSVEVDRNSLESALLNLILNARDAMAGKGSLTIETANVRIDEAYIDSREEELAPGRYVMLAVSDNGEGIKQSDLASIFEPFFTTKPPGSGSGLGLSMTFGFMGQSGGAIQVYTEVGVGTTFKLYFPATSAIKILPAKPKLNRYEAAGDGQRVLIAEDESAVRETLVIILERAGYQVTATASGDDAFTVFEANPTFDMLLTDIVMPGKLQGTDLAKALRKNWPDLPVVFMSGYASEATVHGNGLRPEDVRLMKPVQRAALLAALAKASKARAGGTN